MPIPLILSFPIFLLLAGFTLGKTWILGRFVLEGFDFEATMKVLKQDKSLYIDDLTSAIWQLSRAKDIQGVLRGTHALKRVLDSLPAETRNGLNKTMQLDAFCRAVVANSLARGARVLIAAPQQSKEDEVHHLQRVLFGLMLTGRAGKQLTDDQRTECIFTLDGLLKERPQTHALRSCLMTFLPEKGVVIADALKELPEMEAVAKHIEPGYAPLYIAYALGGDLTIHHPDGVLMDQLTQRYPEAELDG